MMRAVVILALFALAAGQQEEVQQQQRKLSRLRNRQAVFEVASNHREEHRPQGLLTVAQEEKKAQRPHKPRGQRKMKSAKAATRTIAAKSDKATRTAENQKTRQESDTVDMSMSMMLRQADFSMSMEAEMRQAQMSMS
ncbi:MAG: hypothetical protein SGARI_003579, partial [Bacillariaceae sp.]